MRRIGLVLVAVALPTVAALADDRPPMKPTRDATVTYKTVGADGEHMIKMSFSAQTGLIRSDMPNMQGYMIVDRDRQKSTMVMTEQRMFMEMDSRMNPQAQAMTAPSNGSFARKGTATIAGTACTIYDVVHDGQTATSCITSDGLALRSTSQDGRGIEATKVEYGALPASYFQAPSDYRKMDMPAMGGQMGGPMGGMMGRPPR